MQYALLVDHILRDRFFHGFSTYSFKQNWIAATTQYFLGHNVANPVNPEDILTISIRRLLATGNRFIGSNEKKQIYL